MIVSMTGFGRSKKESESFSVTIEVRSVNHRFLDCHIRIPQYLMKLEEKIKKVIRNNITRGRIDCFVTIEGANLTNRRLLIDWKLIDEYYQFIATAKERYNIQDNIKLSHLLEKEGLVTFEEKEEENEELASIIIQAIDEAILQLKEMRITEGKELEKDLLTHLTNLESEIDEIFLLAPNVSKLYEEKLTNKLIEFTDGVVDQDRIVTEVAILSDRADITEEITRLKSHVNQFRLNLHKEEPVGRKFDFLIQEMNREVNTIGSKANEVNISKKVVEMKSILEKMKEQVQNIE
ncbi:YicC family protein [Caldibacillus lycopersici]|uniref:YicC family protein n=1 Tax=Perspicuibacillus lycopersici TaxID=1325689 RepID=A0AAE3IU65_9BACI|nr:YicC/YloC family endoribonuclease [Perspicuibacillus lycopersici]MCU9612165.1 YicC family protein [Perspicuibacillus lycopersici]